MDITVGKFKFQLSATATVRDLKAAYAKDSKKSIHRLSFKSGDVRLEDDSKTLAAYGVSSPAILNFKDLGPQIGYRTVFLLEYLGPMIFVAFWAIRPAVVFGPSQDLFSDPKASWVAKLAVVCWIVHFMKRELETLFVHKFSRPTMPLSNLFKNCAYYWTFGAVIGYPLCSPKYVAPSDNFVYAGLAIFIVSEIGNLICHLMLSNMRPAEGSKKRDIPRGFLFDLVSCPNYTFEVASWVGFSIMTEGMQIRFSYLFTLVGFLQMADWANKKHREYIKSYEEYKGLRRKAIVPFIY